VIDIDSRTVIDTIAVTDGGFALPQWGTGCT
jgi:hypothetical protein